MSTKVAVCAGVLMLLLLLLLREREEPMMLLLLVVVIYSGIAEVSTLMEGALGVADGRSGEHIPLRRCACRMWHLLLMIRLRLMMTMMARRRMSSLGNEPALMWVPEVGLWNWLPVMLRSR